MKSTLDKLRSGRHVTIIAVGDSITANTLHNRGSMNWVSLLDTALHQTYGDEACTVINGGVSGSTYCHTLQRLNRDVLRYDPDAVILALGMNDSSQGTGALSQFRLDVLQVIKMIRTKCDCDILIMTPNPIVADTGMKWREGMEPGAAYECWPLAAYSEALVRIAEETQCAVIDHYSIWRSYQPPADQLLKNEWVYQYALWPRMANSTHPGALGHRAFYRELAKLFHTPDKLGWEIP